MATKTVLARFRPQAWIDDNAVDIDGAYTFDVTAQILAMSKKAALQIKDNDNSSDELWLTWIKTNTAFANHSGPFVVVVQDAIAAFFAR